MFINFGGSSQQFRGKRLSISAETLELAQRQEMRRSTRCDASGPSLVAAVVQPVLFYENFVAVDDVDAFFKWKEVDAMHGVVEYALTG